MPVYTSPMLSSGSASRARRHITVAVLGCGALISLAACGQMEVGSDAAARSTTPTSTSQSTTTTEPTEAPSSPTDAPSPEPEDPNAPPPPPENAPAPDAPPPPGEPAPVDPIQVENFTNLLNSVGATMPEGVDEIQVIQEACGRLNNNDPVVDVNNFVAERGQFDANKSALFLGAGIPVFCPDNTDKLLG